MNRMRIDELNGKHGFEEWESIHTDTTDNLQRMAIL